MLRTLAAALAGALIISLGAKFGRAAPVVFSPIYADDVGEGFNDPTFGVSRRFALEYALGLMGGVFESSYAGEVIHVQAKFDSLGGSSTSATLGLGGPAVFVGGFANQPVPDRFYPAALANHLSLSDLNGTSHEVNVTFNSDVDSAAVLGDRDWYYGADAMSGTDVDLVTVALHELAHGLAFAGLLQSTGAYASASASIFDHFMNTSSSGDTKLTSLAALGEASAARQAETTGGDLWWDGALATLAGGGERPKLHAPETFLVGSSLYHLDESALGDERMSPVYGAADHNFSSLERAMMADIGWTVAAIPEPGAWLFGVVVMCLTGSAVIIQRQRQTPDD